MSEVKPNDMTAAEIIALLVEHGSSSDDIDGVDVDDLREQLSEAIKQGVI